MLSLAASTLALILALVPGAESRAPIAALDSPTRHVRTTEHTMRKLIRTGYQLSPTFAALIARLDESDVIVYVEELPRLPGALEGRMLILPAPHGFRYVRIQIALRGSPSDSIAIIGHELRHAVEVADAADVRDDASLATLYRRIGVSEGNNLFDTIAAQETGKRVLKELVS